MRSRTTLSVSRERLLKSEREVRLLFLSKLCRTCIVGRSSKRVGEQYSYFEIRSIILAYSWEQLFESTTSGRKILARSEVETSERKVVCEQRVLR
jgi:hypothetical protein